MKEVLNLIREKDENMDQEYEKIEPFESLKGAFIFCIAFSLIFKYICLSAFINLALNFMESRMVVYQ